MGARGELRDDPAVDLVHVLGGDEMGAEQRSALQHGHRGVVARGLDTEHEPRRLALEAWRAHVPLPVPGLSGASASSSQARYRGAPAATRTATHSGVS